MFEDERRSYMKINMGIIHIIKLLNQLQINLHRPFFNYWMGCVKLEIKWKNPQSI